jgi:hypothetical protein
MLLKNNELTVSGLPRAQAGALRKKAKRLGMTPEAYVKELIAEDIELDVIASTQSFAKLAAPFRKALAGLSDNEINVLARPPRRKSKR